MSDIESWLRKNNMTTNELATLAQCSRQVIWKLKHNLAIDTKIALRIREVTGFEVNPDCRPQGGQVRV